MDAREIYSLVSEKTLELIRQDVQVYHVIAPHQKEFKKQIIYMSAEIKGKKKFNDKMQIMIKNAEKIN